jgi:hypothetical protein
MGWVVVLIGLVFALLVAIPHQARETEDEESTEDGGSRHHALNGMEDA